jgi:DNA mismatch repair protein MutL
MGRISILSEELINKIAAGEVVERPASIVKELAENSLDAGARQIRIALSAGGCSRISVTDDGVGMSRADAELAMLRHATSKLRNLDDLFRIDTLGFRGEALPSIASVSRFTMTTAEPDSSAGFRLRVEGGEIVERAESAPIGGTSIDVEDLFYNVPARRKFMRRPQTELVQAQEAVVRLALAHPEVGFIVEHEGRVLLSCAPGSADPRERLALALGAEIYPHAIEVEERRLGVSVTGYIASPDFTLPNARGIYTFVNRRYVRDRGLNHAIGRAFRDVLPSGRQPVMALMLEVDPQAVDVNVHPQKLEVRFADSPSVYDAVFAALRRALLPGVESGDRPRPGPGYAHAVQQFLGRAQVAAWGGPLPLPGVESPAPGYDRPLPRTSAARPPGYFSSLRYLGTAGKRFWICEGQDGFLVALDSHAALERVRRDALEKASAGQSARQRSLFSTTVKLKSDEIGLLESHSDILKAVGLEVDSFGPGAVAIKSLPSELVGADYHHLLADIAAEISRSQQLSGGEQLSAGDVLPILACYAASRADSLSAEQVQALMAELDRSDFALKSLHDGVVALEVPLPNTP